MEENTKQTKKQSYIEVPQVIKNVDGEPDRVVAVGILSTPVTDLVVIACRKVFCLVVSVDK